MPSAFTPRNRLTKQATGENTNTWGLILNNGVFELIDFLADGVVTVSAGGATMLTTANGATDQARARIINFTGNTPGTITIPSVEKFYLVRAATQPVTITNGVSSVTVVAGDSSPVITDGSDVWKVQANDRGGFRQRNFGSPTANSDGSTKKYVDDAVLAVSGGNYPGLVGNRGRYLRVKADETGPEWEPDEIRITTNYGATVGDRIVANTTGGALTITLPASPQSGDWVHVRDGGNSESNPGWSQTAAVLNGNGSLINGSATVNLNIKGAAVFARYQNGSWSVSLG